MHSPLRSLFATCFCIFLAGCSPANPTQVNDAPEEEKIPVAEEVEVTEEESEGEYEEASIDYFCEAKDHVHPRGTLTAHYKGGILTGWTCTLSSHHICTAPPDGVWTECTYEPPGWPEPVAQEFLRNPPPAESEEDEEYDEYDEEDGEEVGVE